MTRVPGRPAQAPSLLDDPLTRELLDPENIGYRIAMLPQQIAEAWAISRAAPLPCSFEDLDRIVVIGMGGSGIGGRLIRALGETGRAEAPITVVSSYSLPRFVNHRSLVLGTSNSGGTEETLSAFKQALEAGARCLAITTGGRLAELAREHGAPVMTFRWDWEPRSALGWSFIAPLAICMRAGFFRESELPLNDAIRNLHALGQRIGLDVSEADNPAKQLARRLSGRLPVIIGSDVMSPVAYRWRTQINENAKSWAVAEELPEMNHNAQAAFALPLSTAARVHAVFLRHASMHLRVRLRVGATMDEMSGSGATAEVLDVPGENPLTEMLWATHFGDFVSYYLALLNNVKPSPVEALTRLKRALATSLV